MKAFVFPGQGAQFVGMGKDLYESSALAKELFEKAKQTGEKQLLNKWPEPCNDPKEECDVDIVYVWIMPDGSKTKSRHHTW